MVTHLEEWEISRSGVNSKRGKCMDWRTDALVHKSNLW